MQKGFKKMKKLICLLAALMMVFTACGNNDATDNTGDAENGVVEDRDGVIDEENNDTEDNIVDDAADGAENIVDGAADMTKDAARGVGNAIDDMTGTNNNNNSTNSMK